MLHPLAPVQSAMLRVRDGGEEVSFLGLFDTGNPAVRPRPFGLAERAAIFSRAMAGQPWWSKAGRLFGRTAGGIRTNLTARLETLAARHAGLTRPHSKLRALQVREAHATAMDAYVPRPSDVPVLLFKTTALDDKFEVMADYGWGGMTPDLEVIEVPGDHLTMFSPEYASRLAREVGTRLGAIRS